MAGTDEPLKRADGSPMTYPIERSWIEADGTVMVEFTVPAEDAEAAGIKQQMAVSKGSDLEGVVIHGAEPEPAA